uniref:Uncharacterized protein n=1 Tax=Timema tahoe TaxID=61484 RepID=A0A7R9P162_9NEOP|nr:unnamed protein product [Timema tahoe]
MCEILIQNISSVTINERFLGFIDVAEMTGRRGKSFVHSLPSSSLDLLVMHFCEEKKTILKHTEYCELIIKHHSYLLKLWNF